MSKIVTAQSNNCLAKDLDHILANAKSSFEELCGKRIFITGATGFFGCWFLETLLWANNKLGLNVSITALTRNRAAFSKKAPYLAGDAAVTFVEGDIKNFKFPDGEFSHVIHAASGLQGDNPAEVMETIVSGTKHVLDFAASCKAAKFLFTSSGAVYGVQPPDVERLAEDFYGVPDISNANSAYGKGKRIAEQSCERFAREHGFEIKIARCFAFIGPYLPMTSHFAAGNFIRDALAGGPIVIKGDGTAYRSYLYAADLMIWLFTILSKGASCRAYNVGSGDEISIKELAARVIKQTGGKAELIVKENPVPGKLPARYVPDVSRAKKELGLESLIGLDEAISRTVAWAKRGDKNYAAD